MEVSSCSGGLFGIASTLALAWGVVAGTHAQQPGPYGPGACAPMAAPAPRPQLGTFYPDRYLYAGGDVAPQGGYYPLDMYGPNSLNLTGPLSSFRSVAAPVRTYVRGYDGVVRPGEATSFSYPNLPGLGPVLYPTRANYFYGFRQWRNDPRWESGINWIDQN